jgi:hypothetical protein
MKDEFPIGFIAFAILTAALIIVGPAFYEMIVK